MTARDALARATCDLEAAGVESTDVDAQHVICRALGISRTQLHGALSQELSRDEERSVTELVTRRQAREPLAYVLGEWGFRRLTLSIDQRVLVPRPETEVLLDRCLALLTGFDEPLVLDVGTGSGAISLAIADEHPGARVTAIDASTDALALAAENARRLGLEVRFLHHDLTDGLPGGPYDLVVANPPYVPADELETLAPEVRDWEPREALLDQGQTEAVARSAREVLKPGGWLVLETHWHRAREVARLVAADYGAPRISKDLAGRERVVEAQWPE